jgi:hypothetical protein
MNWISTFLSEYGALAASVSALGLGAFNSFNRWLDNKQKAALEISGKREANRLELSGLQERERLSSARQFEVNKLEQLQLAITSVNRLRDRLNRMVASNEIKDHVAAKSTLSYFQEIVDTLESIHGSATFRLGGEEVVSGVHIAKRTASKVLLTLTKVCSNQEYLPTLEKEVLSDFISDIEHLAFVRDKLNAAFMADVLPLVQAYRESSNS